MIDDLLLPLVIARVNFSSSRYLALRDRGFEPSIPPSTFIPDLSCRVSTYITD